MTTTKKKGVICCDYCQVEKDGKGMYTAKMQFAGCKIIDILQIISHRTIPLSTCISLCAVCASALHAATGTIERVGHMVSTILEAAGKDQDVQTKSKQTPASDNSELKEIKETTAKPIANGTPTAAKKQPTKAKQVKISAPSKAAASPAKQVKISTLSKAAASPAKQVKISTPNNAAASPAKQVKISTPNRAAASPAKQAKGIVEPKPLTPQNGTTTESLKKQPEEVQSSFKEHLDDSLQDVIKLTPAKEVPKKSKAYIQLFGNSINHISDSEDASDEDGDIFEIQEEKSNEFECKLCDFKTNFPSQFKRHLRENHGQKRPRIFNCTKCPKAYGLVKTLNAHISTHDIGSKEAGTGDEDEPQSKSIAQLAVLTALKPATKPAAGFDAEYSFAIENTNSSTPKLNEVQQKMAKQQPQTEVYPCEICDLELKTVKSIQEHMKTIHNIEKPRIFKCFECPATFIKKYGLDRHITNKHSGDQGKESTKLPVRRGTIDARPSNIENVKKPAKITARRKTVCGGILQEPPAKLEIIQEPENNKAEAVIQSPLKRTASLKKKSINEDAAISSLLDNQEDAVNHSPFKRTASPKMKISKESINEDAAISTLLDNQEDAVNQSPLKRTMSQKKKQSKESINEEAAISSLLDNQEDAVNQSPLKRTMSPKKKQSKESINEEAAISSLLDNQEDAVNQSPLKRTMSPKKKQSKESIEEDAAISILLDEVFRASDSPSQKKTKPNKKEEAIEASAMLDVTGNDETVVHTSPSKKSKSKKGLSTPDTSQLIGTTPKKSLNKRKLDKLNESTLSAAINENEEMQQSPLKKSKLENLHESECEVIEVCDGINKNPLPHKREMLESLDMSESQLSCDQCSKVVSSRKRLDSHIKKKHSQSLNCRKCKVNFNESLDFINHFEYCDDSGGFPCGIKNCDKIFESITFLSSHFKKKHKLNTKKFSSK